MEQRTIQTYFFLLLLVALGSLTACGNNNTPTNANDTVSTGSPTPHDNNTASLLHANTADAHMLQDMMAPAPPDTAPAPHHTHIASDTLPSATHTITAPNRATLLPSPTAENNQLPPPSGTIAYVSGSRDNAEIYTMQADGSQQTMLTNNDVFDGAPAWSPDGSQLAFMSERDGNFEIYVMDRDGTNQHNITNHDAMDRFPAWSPDGNTIAFVSDRDGTSGIYALSMHTAYTMPLQLTASEADRFPAWSPDGNFIVFDSDRYEQTTTRDGAHDMYVMPFDAAMNSSHQQATVRKLTHGKGHATTPDWSSDGHHIAFASNRDGNFEIYVMASYEIAKKRLTHNECTDIDPDWSPDGAYLVFSTNCDDNFELYTMRRDGSHVVRITDNTLFDGDPAWSPK